MFLLLLLVVIIAYLGIKIKNAPINQIEDDSYYILNQNSRSVK